MWTRLRKAAGEDAPEHTLLYCCLDIVPRDRGICQGKITKKY